MKRQQVPFSFSQPSQQQAAKRARAQKPAAGVYVFPGAQQAAWDVRPAPGYGPGPAGQLSGPIGYSQEQPHLNYAGAAPAAARPRSQAASFTSSQPHYSSQPPDHGQQGAAHHRAPLQLHGQPLPPVRAFSSLLLAWLLSARAAYRTGGEGCAERAY